MSVNKPVDKSDRDVTTAVAQLYNAFPFPPDPILDEAPPGYNWRWSWQGAYGFCTGGLATSKTPRILDAGCGSGVSTEYLAHLNPNADILAVDISAGTLEVAKERCRRSSPPMIGRSLTFQQLSLYDLDRIEGQFDLINCVGVLHHMPDPVRGIQALARKLAPGGIFHIFIYAKIGRWEINLMQQAIAIFQSQASPDFKQGVKLGREIFTALPETNRLVQREKTRWGMENTRDECFADMYLHPHEIDYEIDSLFELIAASGLEFVGFSNPQVWNLERLLGNPELLATAKGLPVIQQYRLIELLDTDIAHYEFFLTHPNLLRLDLEDAKVLSSIPQHHPCISGWESNCLFDPDYGICHLSESEFNFMQQCQHHQTVARILEQCPDLNSKDILETVRSLLQKKVILLDQSESAQIVR